MTGFRALAELATAYAYRAILVGMGLVTILGGTVLAACRLILWVVYLPSALLPTKARR